MKRLKPIITLSSAVVLLSISTWSCTKADQEQAEFSPIALQEIRTNITPGTGTDLSLTRAGVVLTSDPTLTSIVNRGAYGWMLDVKLFRAGIAYAPGTATFVNSTASSWIPQAPTIVYFPNYSNITGDFRLYPTTANAPVEVDQSSAINLMRQDILSATGAAITPAHIITVALRHAQSLLDFTFDRVPQGIASVQVKVSGVTYTPYNVPTTSQYLLILPSVTTTVNPTVVITTASGAIYQQAIKIIGNTSIGTPTALGINMRYIFKLIGLELGLSPVSVVDWVSGGMLAGDYVAITAYPTFRGPAGTSCALTFDTGLTQELLFNSQGECTLKPVGRLITQVTVGSVSCPTTILLSDMIIDLNNIISQCTNTPPG